VKLTIFRTVAAGLFAALAVGSTAQALPAHGADALATFHVCGKLAPNGDCLAFNNAIKVINNGGPGASSASATVTADPLTPDAGSFAHGSSGFSGPLNLPELHNSVSAVGPDSRMNATTEAYETYTYQGSGPSPFSIAGNLNFTDSTAGTSDPFAAASGGYQLYIGIFAANLFPITSSFETCGSQGVLGAYMTPGIGLLQGGAFSVPVATQSCGTGPIMLNPGQKIIVEALMVLITDRGAFADASHTFTTSLDPALGETVTQNLTQNLSAAGIPEPATWALMLAGFSLAGARLRGARRGLKAPIRP
jgi:hypothetical protein